MRRWRDLEPLLDTHDVMVVAVCADTPEQIRRGRGKHGLDAVMLADPDLTLTDLFDLRNRRNLTPRSIRFRPLPIPTTILVDRDGIVRWIDQSEHYQVRSHPERIRAALESNLTAPSRSD